MLRLSGYKDVQAVNNKVILTVVLIVNNSGRENNSGSQLYIYRFITMHSISYEVG